MDLSNSVNKQLDMLRKSVLEKIEATKIEIENMQKAVNNGQESISNLQKILMDFHYQLGSLDSKSDELKRLDSIGKTIREGNNG